ncbi:dephospho-CoA kinase family protein [Trichomonas vaginalis G3]|uniref:Dephospho-CoA kinase family protein n=1 Tax=Trichomonas vaginalis (strain ATCC PRA-98 / G3) TaxID=412133 RepID=A2DM87_TRIV3|nr:dephospho-CoA kinase protein [Trichomonas vaginalis G3]EAY18507.1 dephospho-CoA kinase family protein [Trichomonas vaginalis G3]KAI5489504.1 dephospho-CoA kinase protein [Trichomonas vaginalis G3]|eukprot:XP_001579493.1 dephospho-CoA kinase family protein [Trichomonas vaginalis G3]
MKIVVLTGGIACGKSTVADIFRKKYRIPIIDCDVIAYDQQMPGGSAYKKIINTFGKQYLNQDGTINRKMLGQLVFSNEQHLKTLNRITHPLVKREIIRQVLVNYLHCEPIVIVDIPLYYEAKFQSKFYSDVITVAANHETQLKRLMERNNLSEEDALKRINAQMSVEEKCKLSSIVIRNDSSIQDLEKQIDATIRNWRHYKGIIDFLTDVRLLIVIIFIIITMFFILRACL